MQPLRYSLLLLILAAACAKTPPDCVTAYDGLKRLGSGGPHGFDDESVPGLISMARAHADDGSEACKMANQWANDAERARPKALTMQTPTFGAAAAPKPHVRQDGRVTGGLDPSAYNARLECDQRCESAFNGCLTAAHCGAVYDRSGASANGIAGTTKVAFACGNGGDEGAANQCLDGPSGVNACFRTCEGR